MGFENKFQIFCRLSPIRRIADVVSERDGLDEVLVQAQAASDGPRDPGDHLHPLFLAIFSLR